MPVLSCMTAIKPLHLLSQIQTDASLFLTITAGKLFS